MKKISEDQFCAGWMGGLEYDLWRAVLQFPEPYECGFGSIKEEDVVELKDLAEGLQEWAVWDDGDMHERLIPLADWRRIFAANETAAHV
jgi:hypothetical protein